MDQKEELSCSYVKKESGWYQFGTLDCYQEIFRHRWDHPEHRYQYQARIAPSHQSKCLQDSNQGQYNHQCRLCHTVFSKLNCQHQMYIYAWQEINTYVMRSIIKYIFNFLLHL